MRTLYKLTVAVVFLQVSIPLALKIASGQTIRNERLDDDNKAAPAKGQAEDVVRPIAQKRAIEAAEATIKDLESQQPRDYKKLADACFKARRFADASRYAELAIQIAPDDEKLYLVRVRALSAQSDINDAERSFRDFEQRFPDSRWLNVARIDLATANRKANRPLAAATWLGAHMDHQMKAIITVPGNTPELRSNAESLVDLYRKAGHLEVAFGKVEGYRAWLSASVQPDELKRFAVVLAQLTSLKIQLLVELGKQDQAENILAVELADANTKLTLSPADESAICRMAVLLRVKSDIMRATKPKMAADSYAQYFDFLEEKLALRPESKELSVLWLEGQMSHLRSVIELQQISEAQRIVDRANQFLARISQSNSAAKSNLQGLQIKYAFDNVREHIANGVPRAELIGQKADLRNAIEWLNGDKFEDDYFNGKIVLLDFWAVWCGPCVAAFPQLNAWQEKYAKDGLIVVGVTQYYDYYWDATAKEMVKAEGLSSNKELAALREFASYNKLNYSLAVDPERRLFERFRVGPVPQVVLIDRTGKVRLVTLGTSETTTRAIEETIKEMIAGTKSDNRPVQK